MHIDYRTSEANDRGEETVDRIPQPYPPVIEVPSASEPGRVHYVTEDGSACSCKSFTFRRTCRHLVEARPYRIEARHNSILGAIEFAIVAHGETLGYRPSFEDAVRDVEELEGSAS